MKKGLIFGNSHVGAVRKAWDPETNPDIDFYALPGGNGPSIVVKGGRIFQKKSSVTPKTNLKKALKRGLDVSKYDYIAVCSRGFGTIQPERPTSLLRQLSLFTLRKSPAFESLPVSEAFFFSALKNGFRNFPQTAADSKRLQRRSRHGAVN